MDNEKLIQEARRKYNREYMRKYRQENKEKMKHHTEAYWLRKALEIRSIEQFESELKELKHGAN